MLTSAYSALYLYDHDTKIMTMDHKVLTFPSIGPSALLHPRGPPREVIARVKPWDLPYPFFMSLVRYGTVVA